MKRYKDTELFIDIDANVYRKNRKIKTSIDKQGYERFSVSIKNKVKNFLVHRILAECYLENPSNKPEVNHKNGLKNDNRIENLEWATKKENMNHSVKVLGKKFQGKISEEDKMFIKTNCIPRHKQYSQSALAKKFNISQAAIRYILNH